MFKYIYCFSTIVLILDLIYNCALQYESELKFDKTTIKSLLLAMIVCFLPIVNTVFLLYICKCIISENIEKSKGED